MNPLKFISREAPQKFYYRANQYIAKDKLRYSITNEMST